MPASSNLRAISNANLWDALRAKFPTFSSHTAKATSELFTTAGFEALKQTDPAAINDFFGLSIRVYLDQVNVSRAKDPLENGGFGQTFNNPYGGYIQRMAIDSVKPISPGYMNLKDGDSPDPFVVRKPKVTERFFRQNFNYASQITIRDQEMIRNIFISEFGMSEFMSGIMAGLNNGYVIQKFENKLEALNKAINSTLWPLQDTQTMEVVFANVDVPTEAELKNFVASIKKLVTAITIGPQTSAFNAAKFADMQEKDRLRMLIRPGFMEDISTFLTPWAYHSEDLALPVTPIVVPNFGGLKPFKEARFTTPLYPVYGTLGDVIGYNETAGQTDVTVQTDAVFWQDPNENVIAMIADTGLMFDSVQSPYSVEPIRNPRGLYTNYWASSPNNTIAIDPIYTMVVIKRTDS